MALLELLPKILCFILTSKAFRLRAHRLNGGLEEIISKPETRVSIKFIPEIEIMIQSKQTACHPSII